jgi:endonuclease YncB( thermonuclease family)
MQSRHCDSDRARILQMAAAMSAAAAKLASVAVIAASLFGCAAAPVPPPTKPATPTPVASPASRPPLVFTIPQPDSDEPVPVLVGTVLSVTDGDTIKVQLDSGPISVRLYSIDAPEKDQPWGLEARAALASRVDRRQVDLAVEAQDRYERLVATVFLGDENISAWMVREGNAWAYRDYLKDASYCYSEADARARHLGLWSLPPSSTYAPWEWRAHQRDGSTSFSNYSQETAANCVAAMHGSRAPTGRASAASAAPSVALPAPATGCRIKGNISQNGKIYHVPGSPSYEQTKIDESKGERWFCTEAEARTAGWRPPR